VDIYGPHWQIGSEEGMKPIEHLTTEHETLRSKEQGGDTIPTDVGLKEEEERRPGGDTEDAPALPEGEKH